MSAVVLENAAFAYPSAPDQLVLEGLNGEISLDGHTLVLGGNGSGKTALARLLAGLDNPAAGFVRWPADSQVAERASFIRAGVVFAQPEFQFQGFSVHEELCAGLLYQGIAAPRAGKLAGELAGALGFENLLSSALDSLDRPTRLAVLVSSFLLLRPRLLVLDFSLTELAGEFRKKLLATCNERKSPALVMLSREAGDIPLLSGACLYVLNSGRLDEINIARDYSRGVDLLRGAGVAMPLAGIPAL